MATMSFWNGPDGYTLGGVTGALAVDEAFVETVLCVGVRIGAWWVACRCDPGLSGDPVSEDVLRQGEASVLLNQGGINAGTTRAEGIRKA